MRSPRIFIAAAWIGVVLAATPVSAGPIGIVDSFDSYSRGALASVSGGRWDTWLGTSTDARVVRGGLSSPNALRFDNTYADVVTYSPLDLFASGATATLSFNFRVPSGNANMALYFVLGSGDPGNSSINYGSEVATLVIGYGSTGSDVNLYDANFAAFPFLATVSTDAWHSVSLIALPTGSFTVFIDGTLVGSNAYAFPALTDAHGLNAIEITSANIPGAGPGAGKYFIDNVSLIGTIGATIPEPSTMLLLASGLVAGVCLSMRKRTEPITSAGRARS